MMRNPFILKVGTFKVQREVMGLSMSKSSNRTSMEAQLFDFKVNTTDWCLCDCHKVPCKYKLKSRKASLLN